MTNMFHYQLSGNRSIFKIHTQSKVQCKIYPIKDQIIGAVIPGCIRQTVLAILFLHKEYFLISIPAVPNKPSIRPSRGIVHCKT